MTAPASDETSDSARDAQVAAIVDRDIAEARGDESDESAEDEREYGDADELLDSGFEAFDPDEVPTGDLDDALVADAEPSEARGSAALERDVVSFFDATFPSASFVRLERHFDATDLLEARRQLQEILQLDAVPLAIFLGRAADRALSALGTHDTVTIAELHDEGLVPAWTLPSEISFRNVLSAPEGSTEAPAGDALIVSDISALELDGIDLPLQGDHLLLARLAPDPSNPDRIRGTLTLSGAIGLKRGASFLTSVKGLLEAPITLMV